MASLEPVSAGVHGFAYVAVAVLPGKTGLERLVPGLTGTGSTGRAEDGSPGFGSREPLS